MTNLLVFKERIKNFYNRYELYVTPFLKFMLAFITFIMINAGLGFMEKIDNPGIVFILALLCSFLPIGTIAVFSAILILAHIYAVSLEVALVTMVIMLLMFLLYYRFTPRDSYIIIITPIAFILNLPYAVPLAAGLLGTPVSAVSIAFGTIIYYLIKFVRDNSAALSNLDGAVEVQNYMAIIDSLISNKTMILLIVAFAAALTAVYVIRRMSFDHSWFAAIVTGTLAELLVIVVGILTLDIDMNFGSLILGVAVSFIIAAVLRFFVFSVDYTRTEYVQFEDDEYYYYVKAVPKLVITAPEKKIKHINKQKL